MWLCKTKILWKCKPFLYGYREIHYSCKTDDIYKDIEEDVETRFGISNYESSRRFHKEKILLDSWKMNYLDKSWKNLLGKKQRVGVI